LIFRKTASLIDGGARNGRERRYFIGVFSFLINKRRFRDREKGRDGAFLTFFGCFPKNCENFFDFPVASG
jgi:hypothetical protein